MGGLSRPGLIIWTYRFIHQAATVEDAREECDQVPLVTVTVGMQQVDIIIAGGE